MIPTCIKIREKIIENTILKIIIMQYINQVYMRNVLEVLPIEEFRANTKENASMTDALERVYSDVFIGSDRYKIYSTYGGREIITEYRVYADNQLLMTAVFNEVNLISAKGSIVDRSKVEEILMFKYKDELEDILDDYSVLLDGGHKTENAIIYILPITRKEDKVLLRVVTADDVHDFELDTYIKKGTIRFDPPDEFFSLL